MTWKIQAITGEMTGQEIDIDRDMLIGRSQEADIVLQSGEISRRHAAFLLKDKALWVQDLGSSNGTFVNDLRIDHETLLKENDIVQFASLKFSVLEPAAIRKMAESDALETNTQENLASETHSDLVSANPPIEQPIEAIATAEVKSPVEDKQAAAQQMNEQGMPSLSERSTDVSVSANGMPQNISVPKPAPIPEGVDVHATPEPKPVVIPETKTMVEQEKEQRKNASVGLMTIIVLIILAVIAWLFFK